MSKRNVTVPRAVKGCLENHIEAGTNTVVWSFRKELRKGYGYGIARPLKNGDFIQVFNDAACRQEIWSGEIDLDFTASRAPLPRATHITAQCVKGVGPVHGVQKNTDPEKWGEMFVTGKPALFTPRTSNPII